MQRPVGVMQLYRNGHSHAHVHELASMVKQNGFLVYFLYIFIMLDFKMHQHG